MASEVNFQRYQRQLALPEISVSGQKKLSETRLLIVGAGGLGAAALPYLAAAGIGHITIMDHDAVSVSNLHRQAIYKDNEAGESKAELAAAYAQSLNPDIKVTAISEKLTQSNLENFDILFDGSDNFETKTLLNTISIQTKTPLISASVNQFKGQVGIFAGYAKNAPCYHCLFPELPSDARNCNEAGILGTAAGIIGLYQAHMMLCYLLGIGEYKPGTVLTFDFKTHRMQKLNLSKNTSCAHCKDAQDEWQPQKQDNDMHDMMTYDALKNEDYVIVDVRTDDEIKADPIPDENIVHMELTTVPQNHGELPENKLLAFVCAGNIRSAQAAQYLAAMGYNNVTVLDKFSIR